MDQLPGSCSAKWCGEPYVPRRNGGRTVERFLVNLPAFWKANYVANIRCWGRTSGCPQLILIRSLRTSGQLSTTNCDCTVQLYTLCRENLRILYKAVKEDYPSDHAMQKRDICSLRVIMHCLRRRLLCLPARRPHLRQLPQAWLSTCRQPASNLQPLDRKPQEWRPQAATLENARWEHELQWSKESRWNAGLKHSQGFTPECNCITVRQMLVFLMSGCVKDNALL